MNRGHGMAGGGPGQRTHAPVVLTFDLDQNVIDQVGDLGGFCSGNSPQAVLQMLADLLAGCPDGAYAIQSLETDVDRYADVHILREHDCTHMVLTDISRLAIGIRTRQQTSHEIDLARNEELKRVVAAQRRHDDVGGSSPRQTLHSTRDGLGELLQSSGAGLVQILAHARLLERACSGSAEQLKSVAAIQRAAMRLQTLSSKTLMALAGAPGLREPADSTSLGAFIEDSFALQARMRGIDFEVDVPSPAMDAGTDGARLRQVLASLLSYVIEGFSGERLTIKIDVQMRRNLLVVEMVGEPRGMAIEYVGNFATATPLDANNNPEVTVVRALLRQMGGAIGLDERHDGGCDLWFHVPLDCDQTTATDRNDGRHGPG